MLNHRDHAASTNRFPQLRFIEPADEHRQRLNLLARYPATTKLLIAHIAATPPNHPAGAGLNAAPIDNDHALLQPLGRNEVRDACKTGGFREEWEAVVGVAVDSIIAAPLRFLLCKPPRSRFPTLRKIVACCLCGFSFEQKIFCR